MMLTGTAMEIAARAEVPVTAIARAKRRILHWAEARASALFFVLSYQCYTEIFPRCQVERRYVLNAASHCAQLTRTSVLYLGLRPIATCCVATHVRSVRGRSRPCVMGHSLDFVPNSPRT